MCHEEGVGETQGKQKDGKCLTIFCLRPNILYEPQILIITFLVNKSYY